LTQIVWHDIPLVELARYNQAVASSSAKNHRDGAMITRWVMIEKAEHLTGLPAWYLRERTGISGVWPECEVWKWFEGRSSHPKALLSLRRSGKAHA